MSVGVWNERSELARCVALLAQENIVAGRSLDLAHFVRDKAFRRLVAHMTDADPHLRWSLADVVSKSGIFQFRGNCQVCVTPRGIGVTLGTARQRETHN